MPRKSHRRRRKKAGQAPVLRRQETAAEREQNKLQQEAQRRHLDKILQGQKTPTRKDIVKSLNRKRRETWMELNK